MKVAFQNNCAEAFRGPGKSRAFTLTEIMIAAGLLSVVVIAGLYSHLFGLKLSIFNQTKLHAMYNTRAVLNYTRDDIRSAKLFYIGNGSAGGFTNAADGAAQQGNAIQIFSTGDTNGPYTRYYVDTVEQSFKRTTSLSANPQVIARYITNQMAFRAEDFSGKVLTNNQNNRVVCLTLDVCQWEFAVLQPGRGAFSDYYRLQTKVARRATD
jgi:hypothetical protein